MIAIKQVYDIIGIYVVFHGECSPLSDYDNTQHFGSTQERKIGGIAASCFPRRGLAPSGRRPRRSTTRGAACAHLTEPQQLQ